MTPLPWCVNVDSVINVSAYLSAREAAERLGVTRATLYAYVSRGWIRSRAKPGQRARQYHAGDVEARRGQQSARRDPAQAASRAISTSGLPVLDSGLTLIDSGRLYYRGRDVALLCEQASFEQVAELLCDGPIELAVPDVRAARTAPAPVAFLHAAIAYLAACADVDPGAYHLTPEGTRRTAGKIVRGLVGVASGDFSSSAPIAELVARRFGTPRAAPAIDAALVLSADHELNASAFAARTIAATRATPYLAVAGALAALSGHRHGAATERVAELLSEPGRPTDVLAARLRTSGFVPGFGHPLYPDGDPRAAILLARCARGPEARRTRAFARATEELLGVKPTIDYGLVALSRSHAWPPSAPLILFALGRSAGWLAHCIEQYQSESLIRPRARYVGPPPTD